MFRDFAAEGEGIKSQVQIRAEIDHHLKEKSRVESVIPQNIIIGPFFVNADIVRLALGRKHKDIAQALFKYLVDSLRKETEQVHFSKGRGGKLEDGRMGSNDISDPLFKNELIRNGKKKSWNDFILNKSTWYGMYLQS